MIQGCLFGSFSALWTILALQLDARYHLSAKIAGLFGIVGAVGVLFAPIAGCWRRRKPAHKPRRLRYRSSTVSPRAAVKQLGHQPRSPLCPNGRNPSNAGLRPPPSAAGGVDRGSTVQPFCTGGITANIVPNFYQSPFMRGFWPPSTPGRSRTGEVPIPSSDLAASSCSRPGWFLGRGA